ncbi:glycerophosphodiester phosphodiesterase family protein [Tistrella mobilis]|uniref:GP-PDE domain-containing protein n=1 Tax=Tistrella mobilis TaxID=171437 RepID=A0A162JIJ0_9PROT|nr:glycerophosphodiester phosphodiesterase family protein [Tistrella mobilis]KYO49271.1 hypothetical protein AUP44_17870 [Tistrella mobilis]
MSTSDAVSRPASRASLPAGFVIGHRGASGHAPENTLPAIRRAAELGAPMVEFDVKLTRSGVPVLLHDDRVDRTTDGRGPAAGFELVALKALDAGAWFAPAFAQTRIPTLAETVALLSETGLDANVEIKPCPHREIETAAVVAEELRRLWPAGKRPPLLSSFEMGSLRTALSVAPDLPRALLFEGLPAPHTLDALIGELRPVALHLWERVIDEDLVAWARLRGLDVRAWTVNDPARAACLHALGVTAVFTDFPDRMLSGAG